MPAPQHLSRSQNYQQASLDSSNKRERGDCAVKALAAACNVSYETAHSTLKEAGRRNRCATKRVVLTESLRALGFETVLVLKSHFLKQYPEPHNGLKNITTYHPFRFKDAWTDGNTYLLFCTKHVAAVVNGLNHDWTNRHMNHVKTVLRVAKTKAGPSARSESKCAQG